MCMYIAPLVQQEWTKLERPREAPWPVERSAHAACCLNYGHHHPQVLVSGGWDKYNRCLSDTWILDVKSGRWREVCDDVHMNLNINSVALQYMDQWVLTTCRYSEVTTWYLMCTLISSNDVKWFTVHDLPIYIFPFPSSLFLKVHYQGQGTPSLPSVWSRGGHLSQCLGDVRTGSVYMTL